MMTVLRSSCNIPSRLKGMKPNSVTFGRLISEILQDTFPFEGNWSWQTAVSSRLSVEEILCSIHFLITDG